ncbi:T9SS type A sorting domain-containing protein, partial [bacterium]|nr:T9SS type A sorting domain-containing protein [bacterium]
GNVGAGGAITRDTPEGAQWFEKIIYLFPFNAVDTFYLSLAKFKAHEMGMTLSAKNIQGSCNTGYVNHCNPWNNTSSMPGKNTMVNGARETIHALWERHVNEGYWGWDTPPSESNYDDYTGLGMETWAHRNIDNNITSKVNLHIVEGVIGRDGNFNLGPNPVQLNGDTRYTAKDYLTNIIIFGKTSYHNDIIGTWLSGHEPGNFGLFRIALERGVINDINPANIPLYEMTADGQVTARKLTDFTRHELRTEYLNPLGEGADPGKTEWKLINDPFEYETSTAVGNTGEKPHAFVLSQNHPNPFNPYTSIEYRLPRGCPVRLEIYNLNGQLVDVLVDGFRTQGSHMATWNTGNHASGTYIYRLRAGGFTETRKMTLLK